VAVQLRKGNAEDALAAGLRITQAITLMTIGLYNQPDGVWLPSVTY
jgi:hypothetical protein